MVLILAVTCAVAVGNVYFPQAVGPLVAAGLHVSPDSAASVVTATQIGYTAGMVLLVPLGDRLPHRPLLVVLLALTGLTLLAAGCAPALPALVASSALVGLTTVGAQIVGPLAAGLVAADRQGAVLGSLLSGSTGGMLVARAFGGTLGEWLGWRAPYLVAAVLALLLAIVLAFAVPTTTPSSRQPYTALLAEPLRLLRTEPDLRRSGFYQATVFAGFSAVWTCLALLLVGPTYGLGAQGVGVIALVGLAAMVCTPLAGRLVDRCGPDPVNLVCILGVLASAAILAVGTRGGTVGLTCLTLGTLLLDTAMQCGMVANQVRVYALRVDARSRLKTAYMTCAYLGGSAGSWLGTRVWSQAGWWGVCVLVALLAALALARHLLVLREVGKDPARNRAANAGDRGCHPGAGGNDEASCGASVTGARRRPTRRGRGGAATGAGQVPGAGWTQGGPGGLCGRTEAGESRVGGSSVTGKPPAASPGPPESVPYTRVFPAGKGDAGPDVPAHHASRPDETTTATADDRPDVEAR